jgi:ubiquitin carboxyl-terminal hydrolase 36/42
MKPQQQGLKQGTCARCGAESTLRCSGCKKVTYCSPKCQREHWERGHRGQCKMLSSTSTLADEVGDLASQAKPVVLLPAALPAERWLFDPKSVERMADWEPGEAQFNFSGCGFQNMGNTCFLNSVLQCLAYTSPLAMYLQSKQHSRSCKLKAEDAKFCAACELERLTEELATSEYHLQPRHLLTNLGKVGQFEWGRQEDASEFLYGFFQAMQQSLFLEAGRKPTTEEENTTWLHQLFGGYSKYSRRCVGCGHTSETTDYFLSIQLNLNAGQSVEELLRSFFYASGHLLEDYVCSSCKSAKGHDQRSLLYQMHPILIVQLMRFDEMGYKLNNPVAIRSELELKPVLHPDVLCAR